MTDLDSLRESPDQVELATGIGVLKQCPIDIAKQELEGMTLDVCDELKVAGCPLASHVREQHKFERFLTELSATFVKVPANEVDQHITTALQQIVEYLDIDRSGFGEMTPDGLRILHSYELPGIPPTPRVILEQAYPAYAKLLRKGDVFRIPEDLPSDATLERDYCNHVGMKSNLTIPLKSMGMVVGGLGFATFRYHRQWSDELIHRLCLVGEIFTNAIERKRADADLRLKEASLHQAHEELRQLASKLLTAQEEERRRIAREMHDDWTQRLAILGISVAKLVKHSETSESIRRPLRDMQDELVRLSEDVHALSRQLHPSILEDLGLFEALRSECACFSRREGISVSYVPSGSLQSLPMDIALCIYRVAQEALRNIAKHAVVNQAKVMLHATAEQLVLKIEDDGIGFDMESMRSQPGLGLSSMAERVRLIHANFRVTSAPGQGTVIEVCVPLAEAQA
jgi:two-component system, NarL family, sensor kinase